LDIKLKKSRPFAAWLCFFLGVNLAMLLIFTGLAAVIGNSENFENLKAPYVDYQDTVFFKEKTENYFNSLFGLVTDPGQDESLFGETADSRLAREGNNLKYYAADMNTGRKVQNIGELSLSDSGMPNLPEGYPYVWYYDGQKVRVFEDGQPLDIWRLDSGYQSIVPRLRGFPESPSTRIVLAVRETLQPNPYSYSSYYTEKQFLRIMGWVYAVLGVLSLAFLAYAIIKRRDKREFDKLLASWSGRLWLEIKILLSAPALAIMLFGLGGSCINRSLNWSYVPQTVLTITALSGVFLLGCWWFYLMLLDFKNNRSGFFSRNLINYVIRRYQQYGSKYSWQKSMIKRVYLLVAAEAVMALMSVFFLLIAVSGDGGAFLIALLIAAAGIYLIYRYLQRYTRTINDWGKLTDHIEQMKNGDMAARLELEPTDDMYRTAQNLNSIQEGMSTAVAEKMKSERMKIELITNVSHDLKTPLTSIISYVDLLTKEEGLPGHVNDYVKILAQKSERLKNLIQDLFDLSKASSDNISLDMEQIDLTRLLNQTLADMEEQIDASGLTFRTNIPDEPVNILGDGQKLYRVWENLITNTLKYSLPGSRVFIDIAANDKDVRATIKNTANYEMNFTAEEILQRFVRGDESRTTEGSGLGLAIARSFTQISGGQFQIMIDGDLFKVELSFQTV